MSKSIDRPTASLTRKAMQGEVDFVSDTLFVGRLPRPATRELVETSFSRFGTVRSVTWPTCIDRNTGLRRPKGFAYVAFEDPSTVEKVLKAHETCGVCLDNFPRRRLAVERKMNHGAPSVVKATAHIVRQPEPVASVATTALRAVAPVFSPVATPATDFAALYTAEKARSAALERTVAELQARIAALETKATPALDIVDTDLAKLLSF